ncbi:MAG: type II toxin-antitoxin system RelE family toxin [Nostoc sp. EkiNYC01]
MFKKLPQDLQDRIQPKIDALATEPRPNGVKKLKGEENTYRIRSPESGHRKFERNQMRSLHQGRTPVRPYRRFICCKDFCNLNFADSQFMNYVKNLP